MIIFGQRFTRRQLFTIIGFLFIFVSLSKLYNYLSPNVLGDFKAYLDLDDVRQLLRAGKDTGITITLWDPLILQAWKSNEFMSNSVECFFLCHVIGPLVFTIYEKELKEKVSTHYIV